jgi:hypothetical protein
MPGKMTKSILRPPFRPPRYRQPSAARVYLAGRSEKRKIFTSAPESSGESRFRWSRGSDPRLLRLTMDGLLDRTFGERPHASRLVNVPRLDLPGIMRASQS